MKKGVEISSEDKWLVNPSLALLLSPNGTESSRSIIKPSVSEVSVFLIQPNLLAGTKRGLTGN